MIKRIFDLFTSFILLLLLLPVFIVIAILIKYDSRGSVFFIQSRVGKRNHDFNIFKFRTMYSDSDKSHQITIGNRDPRITSIGYMLRKYKLDELPQLINVLKGEMSLVGPRPEVRKYVDRYSSEQLKVLDVKPGITDYASIEYSNENEMLSQSPDPEKEYIEVIMPAKLSLNAKYINDKGFTTDLKIIIRTIRKIFVN